MAPVVTAVISSLERVSVPFPPAFDFTVVAGLNRPVMLHDLLKNGGRRRRDRRRTKSCRLSRKFSARTALIPRVPGRVIRTVSKRRIVQERHFIATTLPGRTIKARKSRSGSQPTRIANSPCTGVSGTSSVNATMSVLREFSFPLSAGVAALRVPYPMGEDDFDFLMETLRLWKKKLVASVGSSSSRQFPVQAMWKNKDSDKPVRIMREMGIQNGVRYFQSEDGTGIPENELTFDV